MNQPRVGQPAPPPPDFRTLFEAAPGLYLVVAAAPPYPIVAVSDAYCRATMRSRDELVGQGIFDAFPDNPHDPAADGVRNLRSSIETAIRTARPHAMPVQKYDIRRPDDRGGDFEERFWSPLNTPVPGPDGLPAFVIHQVEDVTDRHRADEHARAQSAVTRTVIENAAEALFLMDADGNLTYANPAAEAMFGWTMSEMAGRKLHDVIHYKHPDGSPFPMHECAIGQCFMAARTVRHHEDLFVHRDGSFVDVLCSMSPIRHGDAVTGAVLAVSDITDRKRADAERERSQQNNAFLAAIVASSREAIFGFGLDATIRSWNPAAERMFGHTAAEAIGRPVSLLVPPDRLHEPAGFFARVRAGQTVYAETERQRKDGSRFHVSLTLTPILGPDGFVTGAAATVRDITQQKRDEAERERLLASERAARAEAERASQAKSDFLATLSHELRTPLTPVLLTTSMMERHPGLPPDLRDDVASIHRNVELESRLISDLLDLTRIERGKLQLDHEDVDVHAVVRSAVDICQREASARLAVHLDARHPVVRGDHTRLHQIVWNLLTNAIKFTPPEGTITLRTRNQGSTVQGSGSVTDLAAPDSSPLNPEPLNPEPSRRPPSLVIEVSDTGVGIPPDVLPRLFNAFEQGETRAARKQAGLGLGLAISRKLAEAHGGSISASSPGPGQGSTFTVTLPVSPECPRTEPFGPTPPLTTGNPLLATPLRILLIEDHDPTLRVLARLLRTLGHHVTPANSVTSATAAAARDPFDLIISDLGLPDGSGLDVIRSLRDRYAGRAIALTGYGMESDVAASRDAGFALHLTKPVDLHRLQSALAHLAPAAARHA